jgi:hypothetical protein
MKSVFITVKGNMTITAFHVIHFFQSHISRLTIQTKLYN